MAPGTSMSLAVLSTAARSAAASIGLRAGVDAPQALPMAHAEMIAAPSVVIVAVLVIIASLPGWFFAAKLSETHALVCDCPAERASPAIGVARPPSHPSL